MRVPTRESSAAYNSQQFLQVHIYQILQVDAIVLASIITVTCGTSQDAQVTAIQKTKPKLVHVVGGGVGGKRSGKKFH